jgi:O-antigen ligase
MNSHNNHIPNNSWTAKRSWITILMFVIGATSSLDFSLVGRVTLAEVIAFAFVPYFWLNKNESWSNGNLTKCLWILGLMFFGIIIADFINENHFIFSARAFARPVFMLGFLLFFIPVLRRDPLSLVGLVYGLLISSVINYYRPSEFQAEAAQTAATYEGIVFLVQPMISAVVVAFAVWVYPRSRLAAAGAIFVGACSVVAVGGARSTILVWLLAAVLLVGIWLLKSRNRRRIELTKGRLVMLASMGVVAMSLVYAGYVYAAPRGYLGELQQQKMLTQSQTVFGNSPLGLIVSGRTATYSAILGIMDRPILGFGSWRHDLTSVYVVEAIASVGTDPKIMDALKSGGQVPGAGHSVLFQAWVENGLIPAIAYMAIFVITLKVLLFNIKYENRLTPYFVLTIAVFSWAFFFSPPGLGLRFSVGLFMAMYVVFMDKRRPLSNVAVLP